MVLGRACSLIGNISSRHFTQFHYDTLVNGNNRKKCIDCLKQKLTTLRMRSGKTDVYAAVLIPVCVTSAGEVCLLYTKRSLKISRHVRQVSFPGGLQEATDKSLEDCALRETQEEIGLPRSRVTIWGTGDLVRPPHMAAIMPVVGSIDNFSLEELVINQDEVEEAFIVPIRDLCSLGMKKHTQFKDGFSSPVFLAENHRIWGITSFITNIFLSCLLPKDVYNSKVDFIKPYRNS